MNSFESSLSLLRQKRTLWQEEFDCHSVEKGDGQSDMTRKDLRWIDRRIARVEAMKEKVEKDLESIRIETIQKFL